jgi:phasin family protein
MMTNEEIQSLSKNSMDMALNSWGAWTKAAQAIAVEAVDYAKKSAECSAAAWEKLVAAKTLEKAMQVQAEYLKSSCEEFVAEATRFGELYVDLAKEAYKPFEGILPKASAGKS